MLNSPPYNERSVFFKTKRLVDVFFTCNEYFYAVCRVFFLHLYLKYLKDNSLEKLYKLNPLT